ncbi:MAG: acyl-CoA dehydrogenase family protein [Paracoccaceae bacterium]
MLVYTDEETLLSDTVQAMLAAASPVSTFRALRDKGETQNPALWSEMAELGLAGVLVPEEAGGSGMGVTAASLIGTSLGQNLAITPFISTSVIAATALKTASTDLHKESLEQISQGKLTYALALDEGQKFNPSHIETRAEPYGNGFRLNGEKSFVVQAGGADRLLVLARTGDGPDDLTLFSIGAEQAGLEQQEKAMVDHSDAARLVLSNVEVTGEDIVGQQNESWRVLRPALFAGQTVLAAEMMGVANGAMQMTFGYLKDRKQFGVEIGRFQALQHRAAHLWCEAEVSAAAVLNAGRMMDENPEQAGLAVSLAKARAIKVAKLAVLEGVQMHGGIGMTDAFDMGFFLKKAQVSTEWLGDYGYHAEIIASERGF